jgi:hypothetical protein
MVQYDPEEMESSKIFQKKFGEFATSQALNILSRNLLRVVDQDEEDYEKYTLSLSILNFLKSATHAPLMQRQLRNRKKIFKEILLNEERYSSPRIEKIPIDIENSFIGRDIICLVDTLRGSDTLEAYSDVSLRVLMRMADVLMFRHYCYTYDVSISAGI